METAITLRPKIICTKCNGTGFTEIRCQSIRKEIGRYWQCSRPASYEVDGVPCCKVHYDKQYRDYLKGLKNGTTNKT